ncbi:hypothetical protein MLD38_002002 [Melastoma candidum]|uniref:Uncharacterized protein n=1 Tax=Melastoma candidum TaxID=119954 RepID=A0ACB9SEI2_9MYRT|nr:hypothetical protein MLD38_002002 [Melastoma candidum]
MKNDYLHPKPLAAPPPPHLFPKLNPNFPATSSSSPSATTTLPPPPPPVDGATIEVTRRPRGRPPGSKNKPKPPLVVTQDPDPTSLPMSPYVLEIPPRNDIVESISRFCRRNSLSLLLLSASGTISNFTLRQHSPTPASSTINFQGRFEMLSLSAAFLGEGNTKVGDGVVVTVAGPRGQIVGGKVVGRLVAAGTVVVVAASFNGPSFHRLGEDGEQEGADLNGKENAQQEPGDGVLWAGRPPPQQQLPRVPF